MGEVCADERGPLKTRAAIKLLLQERQLVEQFFDDARAADRIKHAGVVTLYDAGFYKCSSILIMEFFGGNTQTPRRRRAERRSHYRIGDIVRRLANVLAATHAAPIAHRDLESDNMFLVEDAEQSSGKRVKVLDSNIAELDTARSQETRYDGNTGYVAPEQWTDTAQPISALIVPKGGRRVWE